MPPQITCTFALPGKTETIKHKNWIFHSLY